MEYVLLIENEKQKAIIKAMLNLEGKFISDKTLNSLVSISIDAKLYEEISKCLNENF